MQAGIIQIEEHPRFIELGFVEEAQNLFDEHRSLFLRGLSLFHGWLPFLLVYLVFRLGYDRRALMAWTTLAFILCLIAFFLLPPAGAQLADPKLPLNVNLVFGSNDAHPQTWMPPRLYLVVWVLALFSLAYLPIHLVLKKIQRDRAGNEAVKEALSRTRTFGRAHKSGRARWLHPPMKTPVTASPAGSWPRRST